MTKQTCAQKNNQKKCLSEIYNFIIRINEPEEHNISMLSGKIFKTMKFEIFHFVQDDNQLVIIWEG